MKDAIKIILGFAIFFTVVILIGSAIGCGEVEEERKLMTVKELRDLLNNRDIDTLALVPAALKTVPALAFPTATKAQFIAQGNMISQSLTNEYMIPFDTILAVMRDSISGGGSQTLTYTDKEITIENGNTVLITGFADSIETKTAIDEVTTYINNLLAPAVQVNIGDISDLQDSIIALRSDVNSINSGLPANAAIVYILSGQSNADGRALNSDATAGELDASSTIQIWNRYKKVFEPLD